MARGKGKNRSGRNAGLTMTDQLMAKASRQAGLSTQIPLGLSIADRQHTKEEVEVMNQYWHDMTMYEIERVLWDAEDSLAFVRRERNVEGFEVNGKAGRKVLESLTPNDLLMEALDGDLGELQAVRFHMAVDHHEDDEWATVEQLRKEDPNKLAALKAAYFPLIIDLLKKKKGEYVPTNPIFFTPIQDEIFQGHSPNVVGGVELVRQAIAHKIALQRAAEPSARKAKPEPSAIQRHNHNHNGPDGDVGNHRTKIGSQCTCHAMGKKSSVPASSKYNTNSRYHDGDRTRNCTNTGPEQPPRTEFEKRAIEHFFYWLEYRIRLHKYSEEMMEEKMKKTQEAASKQKDSRTEKKGTTKGVKGKGRAKPHPDGSSE